MSDLIEFKIEGLKELEKELLQLPDKLARRSLARAASEGARMVRDKARENARRLGLVDSGTLVKSIRMKKRRSRNWKTTQIYRVYHSAAPYKKKGSTTKWGHTYNYGWHYEYGFTDPSGRRVQRPHLRPALDDNFEAVSTAVKERLRWEIWQIQQGKIMRPKR